MKTNEKQELISGELRRFMLDYPPETEFICNQRAKEWMEKTKVKYRAKPESITKYISTDLMKNLVDEGLARLKHEIPRGDIAAIKVYVLVKRKGSP